MSNTMKKVLALALMISIICTEIPHSITARATNTETQNTGTENTETDILEEVSDTVSDEPYIIDEIVEKRDAYTKYFLMSDRSEMAAVYGQPIHYEEDGAWVQVDNSFSKAKDDDSGDTVLENAANPFKIKFSKKAKDKNLVRISQDRYKINWALEGVEKVKAVVSDSGEEDQESELTSLKNLNGIVTYPEIMDNVNLKYTVDADSVKEEIV